MKRLAWFLGSVVFLVWLAGPQPIAGAIAPANSAPRSVSQGDEELHLACNGRWCEPVPGCEPNSCATDADCGCSEEARTACTPEVGNWSEDNCSCTRPECNSSDRDRCVNNWGTWDSGNCTCANECQPGWYVLVTSEWTDECVWCLGCYWGERRYVVVDFWEAYCSDGRLFDAWSSMQETYYEDFSWSCADECWVW
jgi:hypothetical protein